MEYGVFIREKLFKDTRDRISLKGDPIDFPAYHFVWAIAVTQAWKGPPDISGFYKPFRLSFATVDASPFFNINHAEFINESTRFPVELVFAGGILERIFLKPCANLFVAAVSQVNAPLLLLFGDRNEPEDLFCIHSFIVRPKQADCKVLTQQKIVLRFFGLFVILSTILIDKQD